MGEETRLQQKLLDKQIKGLYVPGACVKHYVPVQNCTKEWILQRASRYGATLGDSYPINDYKKLLGVPIYHFRIVINQLLQIILNIGNKKRQFKYRYHLAIEVALIRKVFINKKRKGKA